MNAASGLDREGTPTTSASFGDPVRDPDALTSEERRAICGRGFGPPEWIMAFAFTVAAGATLVGVLARTPAPDVARTELPRVRAAAMETYVERAAPFVDGDRAVFCLSLWDTFELDGELLEHASRLALPVRSEADCRTPDSAIADAEQYPVALGRVRWHPGGYAQIAVDDGAERSDLYTLKQRDGVWRVIRIEPIRY